MFQMYGNVDIMIMEYSKFRYVILEVWGYSSSNKSLK